MDSDRIELQRQIDALEDEVRELRRMIGRVPLRVPPGGGFFGGAGKSTVFIHIKPTWAALNAVTGREGELGLIQDDDLYFAWRATAVGSWDYIAADAAALAAIVGMTTGQLALQQDTVTTYEYTGSAWSEITPPASHWAMIMPAYRGATKEDLPAVDSPALGFVQTGDNAEHYYIREGTAGDGSWYCYNYTEAP